MIQICSLAHGKAWFSKQSFNIMFLRTCLKDYSTCFTLGMNLFLTPWWCFFWHSFPLKNPCCISILRTPRHPPQSRTNTCDLFGYLQAFTPVVVQRIGWIALSLSDCSQIWAMCVFLCQCQTPLSYENPVFFPRWESKNVNFERTYLPRWWFQKFYFHPYLDLGKWSNLTYIFKMGWNHQLATFS